MAIAIIDTWLKDPRRTYDHGRQLYDQYGDNKLLKALFSKGHQTSHYHFTRLNDALADLNTKITIQSANKVRPLQIPKLEDIPLPPKRNGFTDAEWLKFPDAVKDMYTRVYRLHPYTQLLFNQSRGCDNEDHRKELDALIVEGRNEINLLWKAIKDYHENGHLKEKVEVKEKIIIDELPLAELIKLNKNLPTYLSKDRDKIKTMADGPQKNKVLTRIMEREVQFDLVKKRLEAKA